MIAYRHAGDARLRRLASEELTAPACTPRLGPFSFENCEKVIAMPRFYVDFRSGGSTASE
jgi:hypothetical protein